MTEVIQNGQRLYIINDRQYDANQYDRMFKPAHGLKMIAKPLPDNPNKRNEWLKNKKSY